MLEWRWLRGEPSVSTSLHHQRIRKPWVGRIRHSRTLGAHPRQRASGGRDGVNALQCARPAAALPRKVGGTSSRGRDRRTTTWTWADRRQETGHRAASTKGREYGIEDVSQGVGPRFALPAPKGNMPPHARPLGACEATRTGRAHAWQSAELCRCAAWQNDLSGFTPRGNDGRRAGLLDLLVRQAFEHHAHHTSSKLQPLY